MNTFFVAPDGRVLIELPVAPRIYPFRVVMGWQQELERKLRRQNHRLRTAVRVCGAAIPP